jgi:hypothetical protein
MYYGDGDIDDGDDLPAPMPSVQQIGAVINVLAHTDKYSNIFNAMLQAQTIAFGRNNARIIAESVIFFAPGMDAPRIRDDYILRIAGYNIDILRRIPETPQRVQEIHDCIIRLRQSIRTFQELVRSELEERNRFENIQYGGRKKSRRKNRKSRKSRKNMKSRKSRKNMKSRKSRKSRKQ